ncbi:hypothetical protein [Rheinheimera soli]|uniref:hypothetical protein n=1 Tax=Rheinheimera soli TaxID=443616 RepID=UPI001E3BEA00|nr:hypothetical protein [Rheinheimera soli]
MAPLPKDDYLTAANAITKTKQLLCQLLNPYIFHWIRLVCVDVVTVKYRKLAL